MKDKEKIENMKQVEQVQTSPIDTGNQKKDVISQVDTANNAKKDTSFHKHDGDYTDFSKKQ